MKNHHEKMKGIYDHQTSENPQVKNKETWIQMNEENNEKRKIPEY